MTVGRKQWACFWPKLFYSFVSRTRRLGAVLSVAICSSFAPARSKNPPPASTEHGGGADGGGIHGSGGGHAVPAPVRQAHPVPGFVSAPSPASPLCIAKRCVCELMAMLNQQLQPVPCLRNSAPSLWFRQSRVMPSSLESAAGSGRSLGCGN